MLVQIFVYFLFCFAMKPHCVALSGKQVWPENENIYKLSALVDKYCESMHTNLLPLSNKYYVHEYARNMCFFLTVLATGGKYLHAFHPWWTMFKKYGESMDTNLISIKPTNTNNIGKLKLVR